MYMTVSGCGPGSKKKADNREAFWYELEELQSGCEYVDVICLTVKVIALMGDGQISGMFGEFEVAGTNENKKGCYKEAS